MCVKRPSSQDSLSFSLSDSETLTPHPLSKSPLLPKISHNSDIVGFIMQIGARGLKSSIIPDTVQLVGSPSTRRRENIILLVSSKRLLFSIKGHLNKSLLSFSSYNKANKDIPSLSLSIFLSFSLPFFIFLSPFLCRKNRNAARCFLSRNPSQFG